MKRIIAIICLIFTLLTVLVLPVSASAPYQTYTYSIYGTALYSPDAYTPAKTIDATYIGLDSPAVLQKYYPDKLFNTTISRNVKLSEAPGFGKPVYYHDKHSKGATEYLDVAKELISRI